MTFDAVSTAMNAKSSKALIRKPSAKPAIPGKASGTAALLADVRGLILSARSRVAHAVNAGLSLLYWRVGERIRREVLREQRAEYGAEILATLSHKLSSEFGRGWDQSALSRIAEAFPDDFLKSSEGFRSRGGASLNEDVPGGVDLRSAGSRGLRPQGFPPTRAKERLAFREGHNRQVGDLPHKSCPHSEMRPSIGRAGFVLANAILRA